MKKVLLLVATAITVFAVCACSSTNTGTTNVSSSQATTTGQQSSQSSAADLTPSEASASPDASGVNYVLNQYTIDGNLNGGYSYTATLAIGPWVKASDTEAIESIWKTVGGSGSTPNADDFSRNNPVDFNSATSIMAFGTLSVTDTTQGGFSIADAPSQATAPMQLTVYARELKYPFACSSYVSYSDGNKYLVTNGTERLQGIVLQSTPKMTDKNGDLCRS